MVTTLYPLSNYTYCHKKTENVNEPPKSIYGRLDRLKLSFQNEGMRTTVEGILLVHEHKHPHVLLITIGNIIKLPGGRLKPGEDEIEGLKRKLTSKLGPIPDDWKIGECVAIWWRPNFEAHMYPYCPPHITKLKECRKLFLVHLSEWEFFELLSCYNLVAAPFFELHANPKAEAYGPVISSIPEIVSRVQFTIE